MLLFLHFVLALLACVGHIALWIGISNRLHGSGIPIIPLRCSTRLIDLAIPEIDYGVLSELCRI